MNFAQEKQGASRFTGFGIVALIHVVAINALATGLVLTISWFDRLGLPASHDLKLSNRPVRTRMPGGGRGSVDNG